MIDPDNGGELFSWEENEDDDKDIKIPGETRIVVVTKERVYLSSRVMATVHGKAGVTSKGLFINPVTVDPHWNGKLVLTMYNTNKSEVTLRIKGGIATLVLHSVETETDTHWQRKSDTKGLLADGSERYTNEVTLKILKYLNHFESTPGEEKYIKARDITKKFRKQWHIKRKIQYFVEQKHGYRFLKYGLSGLLILFTSIFLFIIYSQLSSGVLESEILTFSGLIVAVNTLFIAYIKILNEKINADNAVLKKIDEEMEGRSHDFLVHKISDKYYAIHERPTENNSKKEISSTIKELKKKIIELEKGQENASKQNQSDA